ncbi:MAG: hypothetical protein WA140_03105 [Geobacteraceae bacterium]
MRMNSVKSGLNLVFAGIVMVTLATFFHGNIAALLGFSISAEMRLVFLGLFWGGVFACVGITITVIGLLMGVAGRQASNLRPIIIALAMAVMIFIVLMFTYLRGHERPRLQPGETLTI